MAALDSHATGGPRPVRLVVVAALVALAAALALTIRAGIAGGQTGAIDAQRAHIRQLEANLIEVDGQASAAASAYQTADRRVTELQGRIVQTNRNLVSARREFAKAQVRLAQRLRSLYGQHSPSPVEVLVASGSLTDAVDSIQLLRRIERQDRNVLTSIKQLDVRLTAMKSRLVKDRADAAQARTEIAGRVRQLRALAGQRRVLLGQARTVLMSMQAAEARRQQAAAAAAAAARASAVGRAETVAAGVASGSSSPLAGQTAGSGGSAPSPVGDTASTTSGASTGVSSHLQQIAACESGGNPRAISPGGSYRGKYQFDPSTWASVGGSGDPAAASESEQDMRAAILYARTGPSSWPVCGAG